MEFSQHLRPILAAFLICLLAAGGYSEGALASGTAPTDSGATPVGGRTMNTNAKWRGFHMRFGSHEDLPNLKRLITEYLVPMKVNTLILEVNTGFQFKSHPELSEGTLTSEDAHELAEICRENGIRLIPLFECLGHQGWGGGPNSLLRVYPEYDETPYISEDAKWPEIYCRSWCPMHPDVNGVVFDLMDELIDAFEADAFHVGMDEVFEVADPKCPRCAGKNKAELFARAVNDYYNHLVKEKHVEMLMWGDRLIDATGMGYTMWDSDTYGIWPAVDMIPKDIIICDWHYDKKAVYPSIYMFLQKGFRVFPSTWNDVDAGLAFMDFSFEAGRKVDKDDMVLGMLVTGWNATGENMVSALSGGDLGDDTGNIKGIAAALCGVMDEFKSKEDR